jgi:ribosomal 50S subunit-recycling heat shock protein
MRLDSFLKETRIIKRRTIAKEFCERGLVKANNKIAKPSYEVKNGDILIIRFGDKEFSIIVKVELVGKKEKVSYDPVES